MSRPRFSIRSFLILINLSVLVLPLAGIQLMRIYESALVRQTESALIAQAAFIEAFYRSIILAEGTQHWLEMSRAVTILDPQWRSGRWVPRAPTLDLASSPVLPPFPDPLESGGPDPVAMQIGGRLNPMLKDAQLTTLAGIRVVDPWGTIVATTGDDLGQSIEHGEEIASALAGRPVSRIRAKSDIVDAGPMDTLSRTSRIRVFVASPILLHERLVGAVLLSRTPPSIVQALYAKRWLFLQGFGLLVTIVVIMSLLSYRLIARPITRLADLATAVSTGYAGATSSLASLRPPRTVEIERLQNAITNMAETLEDRAAYLQDFSRHVSHEFKTPIASIRAAIEVLQDHRESMSRTQFDRFVANITEDTQRLQRLTERLNDLTHAELGGEPSARHAVLPIVERAIDAFRDAAVIVVDPAIADLQALIDEGPLFSAIETLIENAIQHGATEINIDAASSSPPAIRVSDNGTGITQANAEQIFTPFFTTLRDAGGTGLGLTIARTLLERSDATIELTSRAAPTSFAIKMQG